MERLSEARSLQLSEDAQASTSFQTLHSRVNYNARASPSLAIPLRGSSLDVEV
jgi:hypothetical protein